MVGALGVPRAEIQGSGKRVEPPGLFLVAYGTRMLMRIFDATVTNVIHSTTWIRLAGLTGRSFVVWNCESSQSQCTETHSRTTSVRFGSKHFVKRKITRKACTRPSTGEFGLTEIQTTIEIYWICAQLRHPAQNCGLAFAKLTNLYRVILECDPTGKRV